MKSLHGLEVLAVDIGFAEADLLAGLQGHVQIAGVNGRGEAVIGIVGEGDGLFEIVEGDYGRHRAKDFAADYFHVLAAVGEDRGLIIEGGFEGPLPRAPPVATWAPAATAPRTRLSTLR